MKFFEFNNKRQGTILLLSLFVLSGILIGTTVIANIVIREIRLGRDYQNALLTLFGAESLIEEALFKLRVDRVDTATLNGQGVLSNGINWSRQASDTRDSIVYDFLSKDDQIVIPIYNKNNSNAAAGVESVQIEWKTGSFLEAEVWEWDGNNLVNITPTPLSFPCGGKPCLPAVITILQSDKAYKLIIKAKTSAASDILITFHNTDIPDINNKVMISAPINIISTANLAGAKQAIQVNINQRLPWQ